MAGKRKSPSVQGRPSKNGKKKVKCLAKGCKRKAVTRGLCHSCYVTTRDLITAKKTTDSQLIDQGLILAPFSNANSRSPIKKQFAKARGA